MKKILLALFLTFSVVISASAQSWNWDEPALTEQHQQHDATLTIVNRSEYTLTVKVLRTNQRGLYQTLYISPRSSSVVHFSRSDSFYTKTKAEKSGLLGETLYRKGDVFSVQCDASGYTEGSLEFYVSSSGYGSSGKGISKSEFERDY